MDKDLNTLVEQALSKEKELQVRSEELALQSKEFAEYLKAKKHADEELAVVWDMCKEYMEEHDIREHTTDYIKLTLTPSGKYKADDIDSVDDELCDIKKTLNNKKCKAYAELHDGKLPDGVQPTGMVFRKKVL